MNQSYYPVALNLLDKHCLVVGGGEIAEGKLDALLRAGAKVTVVSPEVRPGIAAYAEANQITLHLRPYRSDDRVGVYLVIAATDDRSVNAAIAHEGRAAGIIVNAVDDPPNCDFFAVAIVRRGDLQVSISTNGLSPAFARWMREQLDASIPAAYADLLSVLADVRREVKAQAPIPAYEHWKEAISDEVLDSLRRGDHETARARVLERVTAGIESDAAFTELTLVNGSMH